MTGKTIVLAGPKPISVLPEIDRLALLDTVLQRYENGEMIADLAKELGVSDVTLYTHLLADREQEWKQSQIARALSNYAKSTATKDKSMAELDSACDFLQLQKSRERLRHAESAEKRAQWELERMIPRLYGQDKQSNTSPVAIQINLNRQSKEEIEIK